MNEVKIAKDPALTLLPVKSSVLLVKAAEDKRPLPAIESNCVGLAIFTRTVVPVRLRSESEPRLNLIMLAPPSERAVEFAKVTFPVPRTDGPFAVTVPPRTDVPPEYVFAPERVSVPAPVLVSDPVPERLPA